MKNKLLKVVGLLILSTGMLMGCGNKNEVDNSTSNVNTDTTKVQTSSEYVTVVDAKGEVNIPANPERIVDLSGNSDILSILGYNVVGTANSDAYDYTVFPSYLEETLSGASIVGYSMQDSMDIEGILSLNPDLIIISSVQEKMYSILKEIAPTIMVQLEALDWKEDVRTFAKLMNREEAANNWLTMYENKALEVGEKIKKSKGEDATYLSILASGGQLFVFDSAGLGSILYNDMGLKKPENMPQQDNISLPVITYEGLAQIDADYIIVVGTDEDSEQLRNNSVWNSMRAVQNGNVIELPASPYFNQGYSSVGRDLFLNEVIEILEQ